MNLMGGLLQSKKVTHEYAHRSTNIRNKSEECVWGALVEFKEKITAFLVKKYEYYSFCSQ